MKINRKTSKVGEDIRTIGDITGNRFFQVEMYGVTEPNPYYSMYAPTHRVHVFEYVVSGRGYIDTSTSHYTVSAGDFYYLHKSYVGHYGADENEPYKKIWINVTGTMVESLVELFSIDTPVFITRGCEKARDVILRMHELLDGGTGDNPVQQCSVGIFELFTLAKLGDMVEKENYNKYTIDDMKQYIRNQVFDDFDLDVLASHYHLNRQYLIRKFKMGTGITPIRYYNMCRIEAARDMLAWNRSIKRVATALHYSDIAYFSNCFKAATGYTPGEYTVEIHHEYLARCRKQGK